MELNNPEYDQAINNFVSGGKTFEDKEFRQLLIRIKRFNYRISTSDTGNSLVGQRANRVTQPLNDFFQRIGFVK